MMKDTLNQFIAKWNGKPADYDGVYGAQCFDLAQFWSKNLGGPWLSGLYAYQIYGQHPDFYQSIANTPDAIPQPGDIIVWSQKYNGGAGHVGICRKADLYTLEVFQQNDPVGSYCHLKAYNYNNIIGWLRVKVQSPNADEYITIAKNALNSANNAIVTAKQVGDPTYDAKIAPVRTQLNQIVNGL